MSRKPQGGDFLTHTVYSPAWCCA